MNTPKEESIEGRQKILWGVERMLDGTYKSHEHKKKDILSYLKKTLTTLHSTGYTDGVNDTNKKWEEDPMTKEHYAQIVAEGVKAERERVRKFIEEIGNETMPIDPVSVRNFYTALKKFITTSDETV